MTKRILIIEDNEDLAFAVTGVLEIDGFHTEVAPDGAAGLARARAAPPDLIVLDLMLPGFDGYEVLQRLRSEGHDTPVLILTARAEEEDKVLGFRIGADDYVVKPFGAMEFLARVNALLRRTRRAAPAAAPAAVLRFADVEVQVERRQVLRAGEPVALTPKEFDLLVALGRRAGAVATRAELLREVWQYQPGVTSRTVDIHVVELRRKLERDPAEPRHILTVYKVGYRLEPA